MVISDNNLKNIRTRRFYGIEDNKVVLEGGRNSRMDEMQASIVNVKLDYLDELTSIRRKNCNRYLSIINGIEWKNGSMFHQFVMMFKNRDRIAHELEKRKIPYMIHYPFHITDFEILRCNNNEVGYRVSDNIISLPCHAFLKEDQLQKIEAFLNDYKSEEI